MEVLSVAAGWQDFRNRMIEIISGPCSAETEDQVLATAAALNGMALPGSGMRLRAFRAGLWKPRTRPGTFEGVGEAGIPWLQRVRDELHLPVAVEVATPAHLEAVLKADLDMIWIGARTVTNPFALQELAEVLRGVDIPVFIKNPMNPDPDLWMGAIERIANAGVRDISAVHRGFSFYEKGRYRNAPKWQVPMEVMKSMPQVPMYCDPSHISGNRAYIQEISQRALELGFQGLFIESHVAPEKALSDSGQQVTPEQLQQLLASLTVRQSSSQDAEVLSQIESLRSRIDRIDEELLDVLAARMEVSAQIGECKKRGNMQVLQQPRWDAVLQNVLSLARERGLDEETVREIYTAIHQESISRQL